MNVKDVVAAVKELVSLRLKDEQLETRVNGWFGKEGTVFTAWKADSVRNCLELVGFIAFCKEQETEHGKRLRYTHLYAYAVAEHVSGTGLGHALLDSMYRVVGEDPDPIVADIREHNKPSHFALDRAALRWGRSKVEGKVVDDKALDGLGILTRYSYVKN